MKPLVIASLVVAASFVGTLPAQTLFVDFNQQNTNSTVSGFTIATLTSTGTTALGTSGGRSVSLNVTNTWSSVSNALTGVTATSAPSWFNGNTTDQNTLTKSTPGLSAADLTGAFTLSGFLTTDVVTVSVLGVRESTTVDAPATFTLGSVAATSGALSTNYETATNSAGTYAPVYGAAMIWTLTGSTSYELLMTRVTGAPAISAMSISVIPEPASFALLFSASAGAFSMLRRKRRAPSPVADLN
jgi:hypothetical protein